MKPFLTFLSILLFVLSIWSQDKLDQTLKKFNKESVPYIYTNDLASVEGTILLDTRKKEEYEVSHLKNAIWVGHKEFDEDRVRSKIPDKEATIVVYCSIGVRSENIGEKLMDMGYRNVKNLYGGIFDWKNTDRPVYNLNNQQTDSVHAFSKHWGKLLTKGIKVYDKTKE